ncbi:GNAT family N-acetyltransferase [Poriferisphaera corsica]|nr:GNAT family N-acetyltransferase [Poriferisphaera corsica]
MDTLIEIAEATGLFRPQELEELIGVMGAYFEGQFDEHHFWVVDEEDGEIVGVVYYAPEPMACHVWNTYFIAVREGWQRMGKGSELMGDVEEQVKRMGGRLLLVETSGLERYEQARRFYSQCGYDEETRIRDFYDEGEDKVIFRKAL